MGGTRAGEMAVGDDVAGGGDIAPGGDMLAVVDIGAGEATIDLDRDLDLEARLTGRAIGDDNFAEVPKTAETAEAAEGVSGCEDAV